MKNVLNIIKQIIIANWIALIGIVILSIMLAVGCNFNFFFGFVLLTIAYFVLGFAIEYLMATIRKNKRKKQGKTEDQIKREDAVRAARRERGKELMRKNEMSTKTGYAQERDYNTVVPSNERREIVRRASRLKFEEPVFDDTQKEAQIASDDSIDFGAKKERSVRIVNDTDRYRKSSGGLRFEESADSEVAPEGEVEEYDASSDSEEGELAEAPDYVNYDYSQEEASEILEEEADGLDDSALYDEADEVDGDESSEETVTEAVPEIDEMEKNSEDISSAISKRISEPRRRKHFIFDIGDETFEDKKTEDNLSTDVQADVFEQDIDDEIELDIDESDDIPTADSVSVNDEDIDELFSSSHQEEQKTSGGFFKKALESLKKKRRNRK